MLIRTKSLCLIVLCIVAILVFSVVAYAEGNGCLKSLPTEQKKADRAQNNPKPTDDSVTSREGATAEKAKPDTTAATARSLELQSKKLEAEIKNLDTAQANAKELAHISADAQIKAASIQAGASIAAAAIGAIAQLAGQKDSGSQQSGNTATAPETGATADVSQMPDGAVAEVTPRCVGLVAPTEAQIRTCTALGYVLNGNVIVPANSVTFSNNNPVGGPNLLAALGSTPTVVEQLANLPPGGVVEATIGPALGGNDVTAAAVAAPIRIKDVLTEGVVIGDFRTNTITRYPAAATGDKPPLKAWFTGASVWGSMPALWPHYQLVGKPLATFNYQTGSASDNPPPQTINIGQVANNYVKIVPNIDDARIDLKGTEYNEITTIIRNGVFLGSSAAAGILAVEGRTIQNYLLQSPTGGASYLVAGPYVKINKGGKIIQSSLPVNPDTLSPRQCEMVYGRQC